MEAVVGIVPEVSIQVINKSAASGKLPCLTQEVMMRHIQSFRVPKNAYEYLQRIDCLKRIEYEGLGFLLNHTLQCEIEDKLFDEYGSCYEGKNDHQFKALIAESKNVVLAPCYLIQLYKTLSFSPGILDDSLGVQFQDLQFFSERKLLIKNRHHSNKQQREYDKHYGLLVLPGAK